jgi:phosphopantothenoylcysteine decarboxylase/phosphopantothenate--cysteine ligase
MGFALATEAARRGAEVTVVAANVELSRSATISYVDVESGDQLYRAVVERFPRCDLLLMAAAVADYRPATAVSGKIAKDEHERFAVELERTADILSALADVRTPGQLVVGFAAEQGHAGLDRSRAKLERKKLDAIVFNDISQDGIGFDSEENEVTILDGSGAHPIPRGSKAEVAAAILDHVVGLRGEVQWSARAGTGGGK